MRRKYSAVLSNGTPMPAKTIAKSADHRGAAGRAPRCSTAMAVVRQPPPENSGSFWPRTTLFISRAP
jgi:hypothetical protein